MPFIVREETGVIARDEYRIAVLYDPAQPWTPWAPQPGYNRKLVITHGASCDTSYEMGAAPDVLNEDVARPRASRSCRTPSTTPATTATSSPRPSRWS